MKKYVDVDDIYPIGSIYMNINNINPETTFGGEWEQIQDTFLLGCGSYASAGSIGGSENHTLTINEMPSHKHEIVSENGINGLEGLSTGISSGTDGTNWSFIDDPYDATGIGSGRFTTSYTGEGKPFSIMPPYLAVYIWKRVN